MVDVKIISGNINATPLKCGWARPEHSLTAPALSFLVLHRWRHVTEILIKMRPLSTDVAICVAANDLNS